jgi:predicted GNAT family acetyltransferase
MSDLSTQVRDNPDRQRYELQLPEGLAYATYQQRGDVMVVNHSEVPPEVEGRGIGSALVRGVLDDLRRRGLKVLPLCGFVAAYIRRHNEYQDLLAAR